MGADTVPPGDCVAGLAGDWVLRGRGMAVDLVPCS